MYAFCKRVIGLNGELRRRQAYPQRKQVKAYFDLSILNPLARTINLTTVSIVALTVPD